MDLINLTKRLSGLSGPSGAEEPVREAIASCLQECADEIRTDELGNMIALKRCGRPHARLVLLDAHMDEIGLMVTGAKEGFLTFDTLGGVDARMLPAREVTVLAEPPLYGVIDTLPPHILRPEQTDQALEVHDLVIDVGLDQARAEKAAPAGTPVVFVSSCEQMGEHMLCGKALDDRACAAVIMKAFETLAGEALPVDLCCLVSTQEEVGHRGAQVAAAGLQPDLAVVVDVTHGQSPDAKEALTKCGQGVAIGIGPNTSRTLARSLMALADSHGIPWQAEAVPEGNSGTNAHTVQIAGTGVATALLSLPLKYMHTPVEMVDTRDMQALADLLIAFVRSQEGR